jgi:hypothetical protein
MHPTRTCSRSTRGVGEVDLLVAAGEPESTVVAEATRAKAFGVEAPVATLEHLLLMYLYSTSRVISGTSPAS